MKQNVCKFVGSTNARISRLLEGRLWVVKASAGSHATFEPIDDSEDIITTSTVSNVAKNDETLTVKTANSFYAFERVEVCSCCGRAEGTWRIDPFMQEVYEKTVEVCLCADCYKDRADDI